MSIDITYILFTVTSTTTTVITTSLSEFGQPVSSDSIQPTSMGGPQVMNTGTIAMTSMEETATSNTPTLAKENLESGRFGHPHMTSV